MSNRAWYGLLGLIFVIAPLLIQSELPANLRRVVPVAGWILATVFLRLSLSGRDRREPASEMGAASSRSSRLNEAIKYSRFIAVIAALGAGGVFASHRPIQPLQGTGLTISAVVFGLAVIAGLVLDQRRRKIEHVHPTA